MIELINKENATSPTSYGIIAKIYSLKAVEMHKNKTFWF